MAKIREEDDFSGSLAYETEVDARIRITPEVIEKWLEEGKKKR